MSSMTPRQARDDGDYPEADGIAGLPGDPARLTDLMLQTVAAALVAERGVDGARAVARELPAGGGGAGARSRLLQATLKPPGLRELVAEVPDARAAVGVYMAAAAVVKGRRAAGRVFLEDLAEALALPVTLVREIGR